jgi:GT2 family glycosyltransferase
LTETPWFYSPELLSISFDRYQRYRAVAELVNTIQENNLEVLNVCDEDDWFGRFIPNHTVVSVNKNRDVEPDDLPFADCSFDVAVCIDILEHVPEGKRRLLIAELIRVVRKKVILAAPFQEAREAEEIVIQLTGNKWLKEHLEYGLPARKELEKAFLDFGITSWKSYPNASLASWLGMILTNHFLAPEQHRTINKFFNRHYYHLENREEAYRTIYLFDVPVKKMAGQHLSGKETELIASLIIPVYNNLQLTQQCLQAVWANTGTEIKYEIIVVNNASTDGTAAYLQRLEKRVKVITNKKNDGFVSACNRGAATANGKYLVFLNNDTIPQRGWLAGLVSLARSEEKIGVVGAQLLYPNGNLQEAGGIIWRDGTGANYGRGDDPAKRKYNRVREVDYCSGACLLIKADLFREIGGFDKAFAPGYFEDADFCFTARKNGWRVMYSPQAKVIHLEGATAGTDLNQGMKNYQAINRPKFVAKWYQELTNQYPPDLHYLERASERVHPLNILLVDPLLPEFDRYSGYVKLVNFIRLWREDGHSVTFLADNGDGEPRYKQYLEEMGVSVVATREDKIRLAGTEKDINRTCLKELVVNTFYPLVIFSFWYTAEAYLPVVRQHSPASLIAVDSHDLHFLREMRAAQVKKDQKLWQNSIKTKEKELSIYRQADLVLAVSEPDRQVLQKECPGLPVMIIPNVHDLRPPGTGFDERRDLLFVGNMKLLPNQDAVQYMFSEILPIILKHLPGVKFYAVGSDPTPQIRELVSEKVIVSGYVPQIRPYLELCRISVAPLRFGAGIKGKIGEAMAAGIPVVTTSVGAEGMSLVHEENALVADGPEHFAREVIRLYNDQKLWEKLVQNARRQAQEHYSSDAVRCLWREVVAFAKC